MSSLASRRHEVNTSPPTFSLTRFEMYEKKQLHLNLAIQNVMAKGDKAEGEGGRVIGSDERK